MSMSLADLITAEDAIIYNTVAASMLIIWDHCITLDEEVELVWRSKWSLVNVMFIVVRYMTLFIRIVELVFYTNVAGLIHPSLSHCIAWLRFEAASGQIIFFCVEVLLIMRVFAFYGRKKVLLVGLALLSLCENAARITILCLTMPKVVVVPSPYPPHLHAGACLIEADPKLFSNYWVPGLIFESILFLLMLGRFVQTKTQAGGHNPHILIVFIRDGTWAFTIIFAVLMWSTLSFELTPVKGDVALTWIFTVLGFCGSRLVLNLRSAAGEVAAVTTREGLELDFRNSVIGPRTYETVTTSSTDAKTFSRNYV